MRRERRVPESDQGRAHPTVRVAVMLHYRYWYGEGVRDEGDFDDEEEVYDLRSLLLDVDGFRRVMFGAWNHPAAARWREDHPGPCSTGKPDTQADTRRWWFLMLPFDKAIHGQLLAAIGTKAKKR